MRGHFNVYFGSDRYLSYCKILIRSVLLFKDFLGGLILKWANYLGDKAFYWKKFSISKNRLKSETDTSETSLQS